MKRIICMILIFVFVFGLVGCNSSSATKSGVMIYEVYTAGGYFSGETYAPYQNSYAVLYNSTDKEVNLSGWSLLVCSAGDANAVTDRSAKLSGSIQPGAFFVVQGGKTSDALESPVGESLPFNIDVKDDAFSPERKTGIIALCNKNKTGTIKADGRNIEDYLAYGETAEAVSQYEGSGPAPEASVKKVLRRTSLNDTNNNVGDFDTKDIVDKPANIIYYTAQMTAASLSEMSDQTKAGVSLSQPSGYYNKEFKLTLSTELQDNAKIYYTLDGTAPITPTGTVSDSAKEYTEAVRIYDRTKEPAVLMSISGTTDPRIESDSTDIKWPPAKNEGESDGDYKKRLNNLYTSTFKANIIRTAAVNDNKVVTPTVTATYFVSNKSLKSRYNMPVISIMTDKDGLYNKETGIFMPKNRENRGLEGQVPAVVQFFEANGKLAFTENTKFQLNGGFTRMYPMKAFRINMSNKKFDYDLFAGKVKNVDGETVTYFDRFVLRAGGNDQGWGGLRDPFWQSYCAQLGTFGTQASRPVTVFLDGEYWGTYALTERQDEYYINAHYGVPIEDIAIVEGFSALQVGIGGDEYELNDMRSFIIENDMTIPENYKTFTDIMDVDSYIDYFICEIYCGNNDWPHNNIKMWKNRNPDATENTKWKMLMQDVDWAFHLNEDGDYLDELLNKNEQINAKMFSALMKNSEFKSKFINRFDNLLDTFFKPDDIIKSFLSLRKEYTPALAEHQARWNLNKGGWDETYDYILRIVPKRTTIMRTALKKIK